MEKIGCGMAMANTWTDPPMVLLYAFVAFFASWVVGTCVCWFWIVVSLLCCWACCCCAQ